MAASLPPANRPEPSPFRGSTRKRSLLEEYTPALEDRFQVLAYASHTGTFGTLLLPPLPSSLDWDVTYEADGVYVQVVQVVQEDFYLYLPTIIKP